MRPMIKLIDEQAELIRTEFAKGVSLGALQRKLGYSPRVLRRYLSKEQQARLDLRSACRREALKKLAKLTKADIVAKRRKGLSMESIARRYGVSRSSLYDKLERDW